MVRPALPWAELEKSDPMRTHVAGHGDMRWVGLGVFIAPRFQQRDGIDYRAAVPSGRTAKRKLAQSPNFGRAIHRP